MDIPQRTPKRKIQLGLQESVKRLKSTNGVDESRIADALQTSTVFKRADGGLNVQRDDASTDEYSVGAIISMRLINFQVATDSTFRFGPYLNFVLGSNGTGKSTIVNAIYLLFRGAITDLDRTSYNEMIQHGKSEATVSAQIKGESPEINPVISMKMQRNERLPGKPHIKPQWFIDESLKSEQEIDAFIAKYHIQVNNLCQFLPQFRVAAFSGETSHQRLISTERAIGYEGMADDHKMLADAGIRLSTLSKEVKHLTVQTEKLREKRDNLNEKLVQLNAANLDKERIDMLTRAIEIRKCLDVGNDIEIAKVELADTRKELADFDKLTADKVSTIRNAESDLNSLKNRLNIMNDRISEMQGIYQRYIRTSSTCHGKIQDALLRAENIKSEYDAGQIRLQHLTDERQISLLEMKKISTEIINIGGSEDRYNELVEQFKRTEDRYTKMEARSRALVNEKDSVSRHITTANNELKTNELKLSSLRETSDRLRSASGVRDVLRTDNGIMERSVEFVEKHQHMFEFPVIMPALLSLNITDATILPLFSEVMSLIHLQKFVCQSSRDQQLLTELASKVDGIDIKTTYISPNSGASEDLTDETLQKLKSMGFHGILSQKLDGPEPMIKFMKSLGINRVPYSLGIISPSVREKLKSASNGTMEFADSASFYRIQRSRYGQRLQTETSKSMSKYPPPWAKFMLKRDHSAEVQQLERNIDSIKQRIVTLTNTHNKLTSEDSEMESTMKALLDKFRGLKKQIGSEKGLRDRLATMQRRSDELNIKINAVENYQKKRSEELSNVYLQLEHEIKVLNSTVSELPQETIGTLQTFYFNQSKQNCLVKLSESRLHHLKKALHHQRTVCQQRVNEAKQKLSLLETRQKSMKDVYESAISWLRSHKKLKDGINYAKSTSVIQIEDEINRLNATVNLHDQRSESLASIQQQLRITESQLTEDDRKLVLSKAALSQLSQETESIRHKWEAELSNMIERTSARFSEMFSRLGCRGNITLDRQDPLAVGTWGIDINLAFRHEEEVLSKLSKFRQSGGERAVSTALYLLALQDMSSAPFRVLDEINQGMDENNERMTIKLFVDMACRPNQHTGKAQQYFLITPKMILNMPCHQNMNVTFIFGGLAVGDTDKLIKSTMPSESLKSLQEEIDSENESDTESEL